MRPHGSRGHHPSRLRRTDDDEWTTFTVDPIRWPLVVRLRGRHPLVRATDRIEAAALVVAVVLASIALPIAGAVGTAVYDSPTAAQDSPLVAAVTVSLLVLAGAVVTATTVFMLTRGLCNRVRRTRWETGLDALVDHGGGPARQQP